MKHKVISADNHLIEPPHTFSSRLPSHLASRAPQIMRGPDGGDGWSFDGKPPTQTFGLDAAASKHYDLKEKGGLRFDELMPGHYDGKAHLADMELDGVDACVVFPEAAVRAYLLDDRELAIACMRAYNSWLMEEFCSSAPERLLGLPILPVDDGLDETLAEIDRVSAAGARGVFLPGCPRLPYQDTSYDPMWDALTSAGLTVCLHRHRGGNPPDEVKTDQFVARTVNLYFFSIRVLSNLIFSGTFDRFPDLRVVAAEVNLGWMPFWVERMDIEFEKAQAWDTMCAQTPSSYVGTNVFTTVLDDYVGFKHMDERLSHAVLYSTDYPHAAGLWPHSNEMIPKLTADLDPEWTSRILAGNAIRVFGLDQA